MYIKLRLNLWYVKNRQVDSEVDKMPPLPPPTAIQPSTAVFVRYLTQERGKYY